MMHTMTGDKVNQMWLSDNHNRFTLSFFHCISHRRRKVENIGGGGGGQG